MRDSDVDIALITLSDLNRHRLRSALYAGFAELESLLARLIDIGYSDPWAWLQRLREDVQARLVGYWEVAKRRGVDIGPQAASTLTELLVVVGGSDELRKSLGYPKRSKFDEETGAIPEYRNRVMHPVRPLVLTQADAMKLADVLELVEHLADEARMALADRGLGSRVRWL